MRRLLVTAGATLTATAAIAASTLSAPASAAPLQYVALGDSYSAASGVLPLDLTAPIDCLRSTNNYGHVIAKAKGYAYTDVTCGAATTAHFATSQYPNVPPQLDAVSASTNLITMTIGGNDSSVFINTILQCGAAGISSLGQGSPCKDKYGTKFVDTINNVTYPSLVKALQAVHAKAPKARVAIIGYPMIMPPTGGCFLNMPIATGDVPYVYTIEKTLNAAIARAARDTRTTYVNMNVVSTGHDACKPAGVRWVEPAVLGTNPVIVHPNALGEAKMAAQVEAILHL